MHRAFRWMMAAGAASIAAGCNTGDKVDAQGHLTMDGTVHSVQATDGTQCWKFVSAKGKDYELQPAQVPPELLIDGQAAQVVAKPRSGGSFCNVGQIIDIVSETPGPAKS